MDLSQVCFARGLFLQLLIQIQVQLLSVQVHLHSGTGVVLVQSCPCVTFGHEVTQLVTAVPAWMCVLPYGATTAPWCGQVLSSLSKATSVPFWAKTNKPR